MADEVIKIKELSFDNIRPTEESIHTNLGGSKLAIIGKPGSGKSVLIKALIKSKRHLLPVGTVISGSEETNKFYSGMFPQVFIHEKFDKKILDKVIERQKLAMQYLPKGESWSLFVMDDCMDDPRLFNDPVFLNLIKNGRHYNLFCLFANQYVFDFKPVIRSNLDGVFIFRQPDQANRQKIYNNFASVIPTYKLFCDLMDYLTTDYTAIYVNYQTQSNEWTDCVFYCKAPFPIEDFKFGCDSYWDFAEQRGKNQTN